MKSSVSAVEGGAIPLNDPLRLSGLSQAIVVVAAVVFLGVAQYFFPLWILLTLAIGSAVLIYSTGHGAAVFYTLFITSLLLTFKTVKDSSQVTIFDMAGGAILAGSTLVWFLRVWLLEREDLVPSSWFIPVVLHMLWAICSGLLGLLLWDSQLVHIMRELLVHLPLVVVPLLYFHYVHGNERSERATLSIVVIACVSIILMNFYWYSQNIAKAVYLWETGRASFEPSASYILFLLCISFLCVPGGRRLRDCILVVGALAGASGIGISLFRTMWIAAFVALIAIVLLTRSVERKRAMNFILGISAIVVLVLTVLYTTSPIAAALVENVLSRFQSSSNLTTDPSLLNRYIEYEYLSNFILQNPIVGYGFGGLFYTFDWLFGAHRWLGFSHNGYLYVLFKSGLVGFILLFTTYTITIVKGVKAALDLTLPASVRAVVRVGLAYQVSNLLFAFTLNGFSSRIGMLWLGLFWGVLLGIEARKGSASIPLSHRYG